MKKVLAAVIVAVFLVGAYAIYSTAKEVVSVYNNAKANGLTTQEKKDLLNEVEKKNFKVIEGWFAQRLQEQQQAAQRQQQQRQVAPPVTAPPSATTPAPPAQVERK
jgi:hypothetical protein